MIISCDLPSEVNADCNGDTDGLAKVDECGICSGGETDIAPCEQDCNNEWGGFLILDECGVCNGNGLSCADCSGTTEGNAIIDECGCCGGTGACECLNGSFSCDCCCENGAILDCSCECGGNAILDDCGICQGETFHGSSPGDECDCSNNTLVIDGCGVCEGAGYIDCMCEPVSGYDYTYLDHDDSFNCSMYEADVSGDIGNVTENSNGTFSGSFTEGEYLSCDVLEKELGLCYPEDCNQSVKLSDFDDKIIWLIYEPNW